MVDTVTLEVIGHRLTSIADEMETALVRTSFSSIVKEIKDCSAALFDAQGQTIAQALAIPLHLGTLMSSVPQILRVFPTSGMQEGDVFIANDPYTGGTHLPDISMVTPIIYQGEVVGLSCSIVHHQDIGAMAPGVPTASTSIYQEGLNLPPVKFYETGKPVKAIHDIIRNNVRVSDMVLGDLNGQVAAGNVGKLRMLELFDEYGKDVILAAMTDLIDHAELLTRQELRKIPDGSYSFADYLDNDGVELDRRIKIQVTVTIQGDQFIVDFSGSDPQVKGSVNTVPTTALAAACYCLRVITGADVANNVGAFRPLTLKLPEGSIVNACRPAALGNRSHTAALMVAVILGALVKIMPERLCACNSTGPLSNYIGGTDPLTGREYVTLDITVGGQGARPNGDGVDSVFTDYVNMLNIPSEAVETSYPLRVLKHDLITDSGGAGEYRGGLGAVRVLELLRGTASFSYRGERHYTGPWGLFGGMPGAKSRALIVRKTGEVEEIPSKKDYVMSEGDQVHVFLSGGGGYGDPLNRKPEAVLQDVIEGRVSLKAANDYGVIIDPESLIIKPEETSRVREKQKRLRGPVTWIYDRGPELGRE